MDTAVANRMVGTLFYTGRSKQTARYLPGIIRYFQKTEIPVFLFGISRCSTRSNGGKRVSELFYGVLVNKSDNRIHGEHRSLQLAPITAQDHTGHWN